MLPDKRPGSHGFELVSGPSGDWYQRVLRLGERSVTVCVSPTPGVAEAVLPSAVALCANPDQLLARFEAFRAAEASRNARYADEILRLEIDTIDFVNAKRPTCAEVSFTAESGGEPWTCLLVDGVFSDLSLES